MQAMTTRGVREDDVKYIARFIHNAIENINDEKILDVIRGEVIEFSAHFPIPSVE